MKNAIAGILMLALGSSAMAAENCKDKAGEVAKQVGHLSSGSGEIIRNDLISENNDLATYRVWTRDNVSNPTTGEEYRITLTKNACRVVKVQSE